MSASGDVKLELKPQKKKRALPAASAPSSLGFTNDAKRSKVERKKVVSIPMVDGLRNVEQDKSLPEDAPLLIKNSVPGLGDIKDEKERFKRDMNVRPEEVSFSDDTYKRVPIHEFGAALLRGMGWDPKKGVGAEGNQRVVKPTTYESRPSLLGLGAMPKPDALNSKKKRRSDPKRVQHPPWLCLQALVKVKAGRHQGEYAVVYQVEDVGGKDNSIIVQLDPGNTGRSVSRLPRVVVASSDLALVDKNKLPQNHVAVVLLEKAKKERDDILAGEEQVGGKVKEEVEEKRKHKHKKKKKGEKRREKSWLFPGIRVRVISKSLKDGAYYTKKGVVTCITDPERGVCEVEMSSPKAVLENVRQRDLETALPKPGGIAVVVLGEYRGREGTVLKRKNNRVKLEFRDDLSVHKFTFDEVAEYVYADVDT